MIKQELTVSIGLLVLLNGCATTQPTTVKEADLSGYQQKSSYATAVDYMQTLRKDDLDLDLDAFNQGIKDIQNNHALRLSVAEMRKAKDWQLVERAKHQDAKAAANLKKSRVFLEQNKIKPGVNLLASGLQYQVLAQGQSTKKLNNDKDTVAIKYRLSNIEDKELDSTQKHGAVFETSLNTLIKGVQEALLLMPEGSRWMLVIPPELGYGENGAAEGNIAPNEALVFDMELVAINPKPQDKALINSDTANNKGWQKPKLSSRW